MPRYEPLQEAFNGGEFSGTMVARVGFDKYRFALRRAENVIALSQGGAARRPGSRFVAEIGDSSARGRLIPFQFSTEQAYMLLAENQQFQFFRHQGRITAQNVTSSVTNGTFDSDVSDWDDNSTGSASVAFELLGPEENGTWEASPSTNVTFGDTAADRKNIGLQFTTDADGGDVVSVKVKTAGHTANGDCVARIYTDSSGSPGSQVEGDSDSVTINAASTEFEFTWTGSDPTLSASTTYWVVVAETTTTLNSTLEMVNDQGAGFATGAHDTITSIADASGTIPVSLDLRASIRIDDGSSINGAMALIGSGSDTASAEQDITTSETGTEHTLKFRVIGDIGDEITFKVGSVSGGDSIRQGLILGVGYHVISFTPDASPYYVQFEHAAGKTIHIDDVSIVDNAAVNVGSPYTTAQIPNLRWTQSADVLYLLHSAHAPYRLIRRAHTSWSLEKVNWTDGPYLDENTTDTTINPAATTGKAVLFVASDVEGINGDEGFKATDVGRLIRYADSTGEIGYGVIVEFVNQTNVKVDILDDLPASSAVTTWRLGAWSDTTGWPQIATFNEQRLVLGNITDDSSNVWFSQTGDFENMRPDSEKDSGAGTEVQDDDAFDYRISSDQVNAIMWMHSGKQLSIGTTGGEWVAFSDGPILKPTDIDMKQQTTVGSAFVTPVTTDNVVLYLNRGFREVHEFAFQFESDGFRSPDMTILAPHITRSRICEMAYAQAPDSTVHCVREDGRMAVLTYKREQDVVGWARWIMGGAFSGGVSVIESVATIPGANGAGQVQNSIERDEVWVIVKRTIDSGTKRYVEVFERTFEGPDPNDYTTASDYETQLLTDQKDAYYADSIVTYDSSATSTITGLDHLEGETVKVLADGAVHPDKTVTSGQITLDYDASVVQVGLGYHHDIESLMVVTASGSGTTIADDKVFPEVSLVLFECGSLKLGDARSDLNEETLREVADLMDTAVPLFTGVFRAELEGDNIPDPRLIIRSDDPTPFTLLAWSLDAEVTTD